MSEAPPLWEGDLHALRDGELDRLLMWCAEMEASRIQIQTGCRIVVRIHGRNHEITRREVSDTIVREAIIRMYRDQSVLARTASAEAIDIAYTLWPDRRGRRYPFRTNAIATTIGGNDGIGITIRPLADIPRSVEEQAVEPALLEAFEGDKGAFMVCGPTGSGKTTLMGGIIRRRLEDPACHCNIVEGSAPTELLFDRVRSVNATIMQTEIPRKMASFDAFIRAAMRQEPTDIVVTEIRDPQTMVAGVDAGNTGHRLMASMHTNDPADTIRRASGLCPADQRDSLTLGFVENLRLLVNQRLLPSRDGKRTAIRAFLPITRGIRNTLLDSPRERWPGLIRELTHTHGQSFTTAIHAALAQGRITEETAGIALREEV